MKIFGDAIDDKIFPKEIKRFTAEEKSLIDKFLNSILREDKKSELEESRTRSFNDRREEGAREESIIAIRWMNTVQEQLPS